MKARIVLNEVGVDYLVHKGAVKAASDAAKADDEAATGARFRKVGRRYVAAALDGVSLTIKAGDRVGLIGHNGSGKTTLLRTLCGVLEPTRGSVTVFGRVAAMMSTTFGFEMGQTGRENIMRRGLMMRMTRDEIAARTDDIMDFAELGPFIDLPMDTYSAGMRTRLGFAITTAVNAEIVLMDEWIGAGDKRFAERARERLFATIDRSQIMVLATHKEELMRNICNRVAILEKGRIIDYGPVDLLDKYGDYLNRPVRWRNRAT
ncbi:MAG: ATP-binding cassette domain-containing protein, partial [Pseudomonadota bacterium]